MCRKGQERSGQPGLSSWLLTQPARPFLCLQESYRSRAARPSWEQATRVDGCLLVCHRVSNKAESSRLIQAAPVACVPTGPLAWGGRAGHRAVAPPRVCSCSEHGDEVLASGMWSLGWLGSRSRAGPSSPGLLEVQTDPPPDPCPVLPWGCCSRHWSLLGETSLRSPLSPGARQHLGAGYLGLSAFPREPQICPAPVLGGDPLPTPSMQWKSQHARAGLQSTDPSPALPRAA